MRSIHEKQVRSQGCAYFCAFVDHRLQKQKRIFINGNRIGFLIGGMEVQSMLSI